MAMASAGHAKTGTILEHEAAHFGKLAAEWWDPRGSSAMLHKLNPVRLGYIRGVIDTQFGADDRDLKPLVGMRALDVGCGAGLLCEPLARLGGKVTGIDAAAENIAVAKTHAAGAGLTIDYRHCGIEDLPGTDIGAGFDLVTAMEVIEHVGDPAAFVRGLAGAMGEDGVLILSTPNRTNFSKMAMIHIGEGLGQIPVGTHDWDRFLTPPELTALLRDAGLDVIDTSGLMIDPMKGPVLSDNIALNYFVTAVRG